MPEAKPILVAVDFSEQTARCIEFAIRHAHGRDATIDLLHVVQGPLPVPHMTYPSARELIRELAEKEEHAALHRLQELQERIPEPHRGKVLLRSGDPMQHINEVASEGYDLLVISTHGRTGLKHILLGSVAEQVIRHATLPVLVVR